MRNAWIVAGMAAIISVVGGMRVEARSPGGVPLAAVVALAKPYPNLRLEIRLQLLRANLKAEQVVCEGELLPPAWTALKGKLIAPYMCRLGKRTLTITSAPVHYDQRGKRLDPKDPALPGKALRLTETRLKWQWN